MYRESETVELKSVVVEDVKKEIVAFANSNGGKLYIGVVDDGTVVDVADTDATIQQIANMVRDSVKPDVTMFVHYGIEEENGKQLVVAEVSRGTNRPYYLAKKGLRPEGVYVRQGTSSVPATDAAIRRMIKETDGDSFEGMRSLEQELTFADTEAEFAKRSMALGQPQKQTLRFFGQGGIYTNLAYLLSDQCAHTVKVAVFQGTDQAVFQDRREFSGSLLRQLNDVYTYIDLINPTHATFQGLLRTDTRAYPEVAVREALLNSIVHRDYAFSASTLISIYADRMEFVSVGGLVQGIDLDDVMMGVSVCRNPQLANVFYRLQLIEAYGTGIKKILAAYKGARVQPKLERSSNAFKIVLPNVLSEREPDRAEPETSSETVLRIAADQGSITRAEVEQALGVSSSTAFRLLRRLEAEHRLVSIGSARNIRYVLPR